MLKKHTHIHRGNKTTISLETTPQQLYVDTWVMKVAKMHIKKLIEK